MAIYLIGVNHTIAQSSPDGRPQDEVQKAYVETLARVIQEVSAEYVAEEYSEEAEKTAKRMSLSPKVACDNGAQHRFCDPTQEQRKAIRYLGHQELQLQIWMHDTNWNISNEEAEAKAWALDIGKYFERRERFWLGKIADIKDNTVVFVCGDAHVETFSKLLEAAEWEVHVAARGIGVTDEDRAKTAMGIAYLNDHPEVLEEEWFQEAGVPDFDKTECEGPQ
jgi:hypothetical protein